VSGLVLVTPPRGAGRVRRAAGWPGCCLIEASGACPRADARPRAEHLRQPGAEVAGLGVALAPASVRHLRINGAWPGQIAWRLCENG
jgi:hypothetical protein